ncbi:ankyrin repeat domain-containing protein [Kibdelosporangium aridum]|uniref:Ankyrin repeat domain-containing protein n=1 Tax=Kibdelosporangium aridum TaxID=2030 RepID=A0A428YZF3_KIBAR|nr:ankyrin repeat domain-containing protein [Kibdelosporangium aridum]RSM76771.1 ankyrin repeat domain-containing protein [Kibdelosporangium aridum]
MKAVLEPDVSNSWVRARRFGVPPSMIELATERRLAGDWRGACAAAQVDVAFDLDEVAERFGVEVAVKLLEDLTVLAPDLVRWHMPRFLEGLDTLLTRRKVVLASYGDRVGPLLYVRTPDRPGGPQRLRLEVGYIETAEHPVNWATSRYLWDATQSDDLRVRCGGGDRAPFFNADGSRAKLPTSDPGTGDPAARTEWLTVLQENDQLDDAFAAAGLALDTTYGDVSRYFKRWPFVLSRLADEVRMLSAWDRQVRYAYRFNYYNVMVVDVGRGRLSVYGRNHMDAAGLPELPHVIAHRLPDLDLLRTGKITPDHLHPLVRSALFPKLPEREPVPRYELNPIRVRCQGVWHLIAPRDGIISGPHTEQEHRREQALQALGGTASGCFRVRTAWAEGGKLPKHLRLLRKEIFGRARHGDTAGVIELLDAGIDIRVRDASKRTLLHHIHLVDHRLLLQRLLDAGLDLEATDQNGRTPLYYAATEGGSTEVVTALVDAGARTEALAKEKADRLQWIRNLIDRTGRTDLDYLLDEST